MVRVLILGVNPFEDLPGYQLLSLLKRSDKYEVIVADDSVPALKILGLTGVRIQALPLPTLDPYAFTTSVARVCREQHITILLPGTDAHLYALASCLDSEPQLGALCPILTWVASNHLRNKWDLQEWASQFARTPLRWIFDTEEDASLFKTKGRYPLMVKGLRKGAIKCVDHLEAIVAKRTILRNPANQGQDGGTYAESFIDGEEHSLFLLTGDGGNCLAAFGLRKIAATQLGTTLVAEVDQELPSEIRIPVLLSQLSCPAAIELEWRRDSAARQWLFEVNLRFPSWIGALGVCGLGLLEAYMRSINQDGRDNAKPWESPKEGSILYRLPQAGFLPLEEVFEIPRTNSTAVPTKARYSKALQPLWKSASPHQFHVK